jgi:ABC-2 type transport system permease protein
MSSIRTTPEQKNGQRVTGALDTIRTRRTIRGPRRELNAIFTIAYRDMMRFLRDPSRLIGTLVLPVIFVGVLGGSFQAGLGGSVGFNLLTFIFTGVYAQTLFQSTAFGIISLIEDRENDFSQEIFISPISRYSIIFGKILGESLVALAQAAAVIVFGLIIRIPLSPFQILGLFLAGILTCLIGGAFGLLLLSGFGSQRAANQILPFLIFPQFFLAGAFSPLKAASGQSLPWYIDILSRIAPLRYAVDLTRNLYYAGTPAYSKVVLENPLVNLIVLIAMFLLFLIAGTFIFVRSERNR